MCVCVCVCVCVCTCIMNLHECASLCTAVRLVGGSTSNRGRVEVYYSGQWRSVCRTSSFATDEATTVCRELGYMYSSLISRITTHYGYGSGAAYISCSGSQSSVSQCRIGTTSCSSRYRQYVACGNSSEWLLYSIRR